MPFSSLAIFVAPLLTAIAGIGTLYALHHLRSRPTSRIVETLLFWDPSDRNPTARSLWSTHLRQPLALLILSLIALAFSLALGLALWNASRRPDAVIVVDAGLSSADAGGSSLSPEILEATRQALGDGLVTVIAAAEQPRVISDGRQPAAVAGLQLAKLHPSHTAPASSLALQLAASMQGRNVERIDWFTAQTNMPEDLPAAISSRVVRHWVKAGDRFRITSVAFTPSADDPTQYQLIVQAGGVSDLSGVTVQLTPGNESSPRSKVISTTGKEGQAIFENLKADGRRLTLDLIPASGSAPVVQTLFTLPRRSPCSFYGIENAPPPLRDALLCTGSAAANAQGAIAVLGPQMPIPIGAVGAIFVVPDQGQTRKLPLQAEDLPLTHGLGFQSDQLQVGFTQLPGETVLLTAGECPIVSLSSKGGLTVAYILASAVIPDAPLPRLPAFPILIKRLCDVLTLTSPASPMVSSQRHVEDPLWNSPDPVALVDAVPTTPSQGTSTSTDDSSHTSKGGVDWSELSLAVVIGLLLFEAILFSRKKIA